MHWIRSLTLVVSWASLAHAASISVDWSDRPDGVWVGPSMWANRLQDWHVRDHRLEQTAVRRGWVTTAHLLTARLSARPGETEIRVKLGTIDGRWSPGATAGVLLGAGGTSMDPRGAALVQWDGNGAGYFVGVDHTGTLLVRKFDEQLPTRSAPVKPMPVDVELVVTTHAQGDEARIEARLVDVAHGTDLSKAHLTLAAQTLAGNVALLARPGNEGVRFWFDDFRVSGSGVEARPGGEVGPVISTQHTLSRDVLKLTAQLMPVADDDPRSVSLVEMGTDGSSRELAVSEIITPGYTVTFRMSSWDSERSHSLAVCYADQSYPLTVRAQPVDDETTVAVLNCNHNNSHQLSGSNWGNGSAAPRDWPGGVWFPHQDLIDRVVTQDPDVLFFAGDQIYEGGSPTGADYQNLELDYLYKWYLFCWAFADLMRDRPAVVIPDDHDVYQGNLWGAGGRPAARDADGGYQRPPWFVNMVERTQTSNLPDPFDPTPIDQGIGVYYTDMVYGGVGFAILEDRKFKSGSYVAGSDEKVDRDDSTLALLGSRQHAFIDAWAEDWAGQDLKAVLSQTVFAQATTHQGPHLKPNPEDRDTNGFPRAARDRAVRALRRCFPVHLCGDQHLSTLLQHGVEQNGDAFWSFCGPAIANFWPRAFAPQAGETYTYPADPGEYTVDHIDPFGNRITMAAAANPLRPGPVPDPVDLHERVPGWGLVRFHRADQQVTFECWPRSADPRDDSMQYPGWPHTVELAANYGRKPQAWLPPLEVVGVSRPVVMVREKPSGELVYARRFAQPTLRLGVFAIGDYAVRVGDPDTHQWKTLDLQATADDRAATRTLTF